ncbi:MAG: HAD hydrolase family protein [Chloroflexi bacterium]|nr:HAD hydrolase family protein [Chloroflexota bacterium]MBE3115481.1 HAD hydrolase family protein [Actinomycetota bacterium]
MKRIAEKYGVKLKECAYIGDDVNDVDVFRKVGLSIAFNCRKKSVLEVANVIIESQDIRSIIPYLKVLRKK